MGFDLYSLLDIKDPSHYKFHAARSNGKYQPLDVFLRDHEEWLDWNRYRGARDEFNRDYIVSFVDYYPEPQAWLFGGIFKVDGRQSKVGHTYKIEQSGIGDSLIGRLKIHARISRGRAFKLENLIEHVRVTEVLKEPFSGQLFKGYESASLDFSMLEILVDNQNTEWKTALENVKGVYVIADKSTGKQYVGSAYGANGIWSRWSSYAYSGHGENIDLRRLLESKHQNYARDNLRITLIETQPHNAADELVIARENYWKSALLTRGETGHNRN